jgi:hypothetical protein
MSATNLAELRVLDWLIGAEAVSLPASWYIGLSVGDPGETGSTASEPSGNGYGRVAIVNSSTAWQQASVAKSNLATVVMPTPTGSWGSPTHFFVADASTGGYVWIYGALATTVSIGAANAPVQFNPGSLLFTLD